MNKLETFIRRLDRIGIKVELFGNYPWVYLDRINGKKVRERYLAEHGFTVAFQGVKLGQELKFTDTKEIFKLIREYTK